MGRIRGPAAAAAAAAAAGTAVASRASFILGVEVGRIGPFLGRSSDLVGRTRVGDRDEAEEVSRCTESGIRARVGTRFAGVSRCTRDPPSISHHFTVAGRRGLFPGRSPAKKGGCVCGGKFPPGAGERRGGGGGKGRGRPPLGAAIGRRKNSSNAGGGGGGKGREDKATSSSSLRAAATCCAN